MCNMGPPTRATLSEQALNPYVRHLRTEYEYRLFNNLGVYHQVRVPGTQAVVRIARR